MAITDLSPHQLQVLKDTILLRLILDQGGSYHLTFDEVNRIADDLNGWGVVLVQDPTGMTLRVTVPESVKGLPR